MDAFPLTRAQRDESLRRAGYNVVNLEPADVEIDLLSDVPSRIPARAVHDTWMAAEASTDSRETDLAALAESVYGPAYYVPATKGRSAEAVLASVLFRENTTVLTHGLFKTTERALQRNGVGIEVAPNRGIHQESSDLDLDWLDRKLSRGGSHCVYLEPCNNGLGGRPLHLDNLEAVAAACRRHQALLVLDATRLLTNCAALSERFLEMAPKFTRLADAFTVSCAKELLVPYGAFIAVRSRELRQRAFLATFQAGALLEPTSARTALAAGIEHVRHHPEILRRRRAQVQALASALASQGIPCLEPPGGHAVYVPVAPLMSESDPLAGRRLECLLYLDSGIRARVWPFASMPGVMRLALTVARYSDEQLGRVPSALRALFDHAGRAPRLKEDPAERPLGMFARFSPVDSATLTPMRGTSISQKSRHL